MTPLIELLPACRKQVSPLHAMAANCQALPSYDDDDDDEHCQALDCRSQTPFNRLDSLCVTQLIPAVVMSSLKSQARQ